MKLLEFHPDKTVHLVMGNDEKTKLIKNDIEKNPLLVDNFTMKGKISEKWLGDIIHEGGLSESVAATVK